MQRKPVKRRRSLCRSGREPGIFPLRLPQTPIQRWPSLPGAAQGRRDFPGRGTAQKEESDEIECTTADRRQSTSRALRGVAPMAIGEGTGAGSAGIRRGLHPATSLHLQHPAGELRRAPSHPRHGSHQDAPLCRHNPRHRRQP